jgi:kynurenine 3-monooxygenase
MSARTAIIIGAGPVGCLAAVELRRRGFVVETYERVERGALSAHRPSFNLTLSARGLRHLPGRVRGLVEAAGVRVTERVVHLPGGAVDRQPYGVRADHYLLSLSRQALHEILLEEALGAGVVFHFGHECVDVEPARAAATLVRGGDRRVVAGDLLLGCDGANSAVRAALAKAAYLQVEEQPAAIGHVEVRLPPGALAGSPALHVWPRGEGFLVAQPNPDGSHAVNLFAPLAGPPDFAPQLADMAALLPGVGLPPAARPGRLKTVRCQPFHRERTVLVGDAAHALLPFYGQGINCSFEDVGVLTALLDRAPILDALAELTAARRPACDALADISAAHAEYLAHRVADPRVRAEEAVERELFRRAPAQFAPLYALIAFSTLPYHQVRALHELRRRAIAGACDGDDIAAQPERIIERCLAWARSAPALGQSW